MRSYRLTKHQNAHQTSLVEVPQCVLGLEIWSTTSLSVEYKEAKQAMSNWTLPLWNQVWIPLYSGSLCVNVDAAVRNVLGRFGVVVIVQNAAGELIRALAKPVINSLSIMFALLTAMREAILFHLQAGFAGGVLWSNSLVVVLQINEYDSCLAKN